MQLIRKLFERPEVPSNSLFTIFPFKNRGVWMFDEPQLGLINEAFVSGMPEIIEHMTQDFDNPEGGFIAIFSSQAFPTANNILHKIDKRDESMGTWYRHQQSGREGWLCPALFKFFDRAPETIWISALEFNREA